MPYGRKYSNPRKSPRTNTPRTPRGKFTPRKVYTKKMPMVSFAKRVQKIISSNVENKFTDTIKYNDAVARTDASSLYKFFNWTPGADSTGNRLFNLDIGARQNSRVGNTIKLKRWIIKGLIQPVVSTSTTMTNSFVGYVDVYFGKLMANTVAPSNTLPNLYQNGSAATTPTCLSVDMLNPLNKDYYKVYYHRRFKMGAASDPDTYSGTQATASAHPASNDFKLSQTFGFDICKYILKNKHLKYNDFSSTTIPLAPDNADVLNLCLWATFTPQTGQATGASSKTLYNIDCLTYAEYEDA